MKVESIENLGRKSMAVLQTAQDIKDYQRQLDHEDSLKQKIRERELFVTKINKLSRKKGWGSFGFWNFCIWLLIFVAYCVWFFYGIFFGGIS